MAVALNRLGKTALLAEDPATAAGHFTRSLSIYRQLSDRGGLATSLNGLGEAMAAMGRLAEAASYLRESINTALPMGFVSLTVSIILCGAEVLIRGEKTAIAMEALQWVQAQDGADEATRARAGRLLSPAGDPRKRADGITQRTTSEMAALVESGLIGLTDSRSSAAMQDRMLEPLSDREKEVLACIARGMSNREIAEQLFLSIGTVKAHSHNIYEKLDASNRVQALTRAKELGILPS
jgi:ATP/maltotriose-dependent transcriptional regulator MalT